MPLQKSIWTGQDWAVFQGAGTKPPLDVFTLGVTMPTKTNSGVPAGTVLTPYDPTGTLRTLSVTTANRTFTNVDFGNVKVNVRAANVTFIRCRWTITDSTSTAAIAYTTSTNVVNCTFSQCDLICTDQKANINAIQGHDTTVYRCKIQGTVDGIDPTAGSNVKVHGTYISDLSWLASDTKGVVHPSDFQSHADCFQIFYGGCELIGNFIGAYPSTIVGTGTPGSGNDTGNPTSEYTQAQAEARRAQLMGSFWSDPTKSYDGISHEIGGVITPLMCTPNGSGSTSLNLVVTDNWFAGGVVGINAGTTTLTTSLGTFKRNRFFADMKGQSAGRPNGIYIRTDLGADIPTSGPDRNVWMDDGSTVTRVNVG